jgi:GR25 family glycosyltransferase involved in LPS biosynthesis
MILDNIWVINMDKSKDRLQNITNNFNSLNIKFNRFSAVDGKKINDEELDNKITNLCKNLLCNRGIVGCAESHKTLWRQLVNDKNTNYYMILEDDVVLDKKSIEIINKLEPKISEFNIDYISLYCINLGCGFNKVEFVIDDYKFGKPLFPLQTCGYIITKNGASKLLNDLGKTDYHIDVEIALNNYKNNFNYFTSDKNIISVNEKNETTIGNNEKCITNKVLKNIGLDYYSWLLNTPIFTVRMTYVINGMLILLILLLILNKKKINSEILFWFIVLELFLLHTDYF